MPTDNLNLLWAIQKENTGGLEAEGSERLKNLFFIDRYGIYS
jgi:hypothetical protein